MKKLLFSVVWLCIAICDSLAQAPNITNPISNVTVPIDVALDAMAAEIRNSYPGDTTEGGAEKAFNRFANFWGSRTSSNAPDSIARFTPSNEALKYSLATTAYNCISNGNWKCMGPFNSYWGVQEWTGRVDQIWVHPTDTNIILVGAQTGGLWKSINGGRSWKNITDNANLNNMLNPGTLGVQALAVDPTDANKIYISTGVYSLYDKGVPSGYSLGILYSTNGGTTWQVDADYANGISDAIHNSIRKLAFRPGTNDLFAIFGRYVLYKNPALSGWSLIKDLEHTINDFQFTPGGDTIVFATTAYLDLDSDRTAELHTYNVVTDDWYTPLTLSLTDMQINHPWEIGGFKSIAITNNDTALVLIGKHDSAKSCLYKVHITRGGWYRTNDFGPDANQDKVFVSRTDPNIVYMANSTGRTSPITKSINGTDSTLAFFAAASGSHPDGRFLYFYNDFQGNNGINDIVYAGTDGGIIKKRAGTDDFSSITGDSLCIMQFYGFSSSDADDRLLIGGAQDNNSFNYVRHRTIPWNRVGFGDGYFQQFANNGVLRGIGHHNSSQVDNFNFTGNIMSPTYGSSAGPPDSIFHDLRPIVFSKTNTSYIGYSRIWQGNINGTVWGEALPNNPKDAHGRGSEMRTAAFEFAPQDSNWMYIAFKRPAGGNPTEAAVQDNPRGKLFVSQNAFNRDPITQLVTWRNITPIDIGSFRIMDIEIDPKNPARIWVSLGDIDYRHLGKSDVIGSDTLRRVLYSPDTGRTWKNVSRGLPNLPATKIIYQAGSDDVLYVGTDIGIFRWNKSGQTWECFNNGMPPCIVMDLEINYCAAKLRAGTFGRGIWETDIVIPNNGPDTIKTNTTWNSTRVIKGDIYVKPGVRLTITNNGNNWPRILMGKDAQILVAGELYIDSATISNNCGPCMWKGIKLLGNDANQSLNGSIVLNNATIEHAIEAIESTGGAISSARTNYINNSRSIYIHNYTGMGTVWYNANFTKDTFMVTDGFRGGAAHYFRSHVELNHVKNGARFRGCRFLNNFTADYWGTCTGLQAINAGFSVGQHCTTPVAPCASGNSTPSSFRGFRNGIWVESIEQDRPASITNSIFDSCSIGVRLFNSVHTTVAQNSFTVGAGREVDLNMFDCDKNMGIYATGAEYPIIEENEFTGELPSNPSSNFERIGTILENCVKNERNGNYITVYKNDFDGLEKACVSIGRNKSEGQMGDTLPGGLRYICNNFTNNDADIYVISDGSGANRQGIQYYHRAGNPTTSSVLCSGNEFNNGSATHISGNAARMLYFNDGNGFRNPTNISSNVMLTTMSVSTNSCPSKYGALIDAPLHELIPDLKDMGKGQGILADTKTGDYEAQIDGGNTAGLIAYLGTKTSAESDEVYTTMWGYSPWLSQDALYTLAQSSILDADSLTEIMMANPEALTPEFVDELEILSPQPFMPEHFTQMDAAPGIFTARTTLLAEIATAKAEKDYYTNFLMSVLLDEDTVDVDTVIAWYDYTNTVAAEYAKASFYASIGDYTEGEAVLTNLPSKFSLTTQQTTDHNAYSSLYTMLKTVAMDGRTTKELNSTELGQLATWSSNSSLGALVKNPVNVLNDNLGDIARLVCVDLYSSSGKQAPKTRLSAYSRGLNRIVHAYPNPANEQVTFDYRLPRIERNTVLVVNDITGREVYQVQLDKQTGTTVWNTRLLAPGVYIYRIRDAHSIIETGRISISR